MPGNLLFADKQFPNVSGDKETDLKAILNYLYMLQEELRYTMGNLGVENFNESGMRDLSGITTKELSITVKGVMEEVNTLSGGMDTLAGGINDLSDSVVTLQGTANSQGAALSLIAGYTGQNAVITVGTWSATGKDITKVYYATNTSKFYKYNGAAWIASNNMSEASFLMSAINGESTIKIKADKIDFTGVATFLTAADVGAGGSTVIHGSRLATGTLYANSLAKVQGADGYDYIAMENGFDYSNPAYMDFTQLSYNSYNRSIQGLHALSFNGDTVLDQGRGTTGNKPTYVMGYMRNWQSLTGNISQNGMDIGARYNLRIMAQCFGNVSAAGTIIYSANPEALVAGETYFQLQIVDAGIYATKYRKESNGSFTQLANLNVLT